MQEEKEVNKHCLDCGKELEGQQQKFCSKAHKNRYNHKHRYNYKYHVALRSKSPRNFLSQLRSYHKRKSTLSLDYLEGLYESQNGLCAITSREMTYTQGQGKLHTNISIDRIDNDKGYEEGNIQLVCYIVNIMKSSQTEDELHDWCRAILEGLNRV